MLQRLLLLGAFLFVGANAARADLNPETKTPYKLRIVLHFAPHRNMTDVFRKKITRDLGESLQAALGNLAQVEVSDTHPLLKDVVGRGLQPTLDSHRTLDNIKTHFVLIDYAQGQYEISARQFDGTTGLASPVVRQDQTEDRTLVARKAGLLVMQDFGLVGTLVGDGKDAKKVPVAIKGGALADSLEPWIQKGDVFAVAEIVGQPGAVQRSIRRPWTILQVTEMPKDGVCICQALSRYPWPPPPSGGSQGLRCLKLSTTQGQLKLRLIDDKQAPLPVGLRISVSGLGFGDADDREALVTQPDGTVQSHKTYKNVAFVRVDDGTGEVRRLPIEIVDERTVVCVMTVQPGGDKLSQFGMRRASFLRRLDQNRMVIEALWTNLQKEHSLSEQEWVELAKRGYDNLQSELLALTAERKELTKEQAEVAKDPKLARSDLFDLAAADQIITGLQVRSEELTKRIDEMKELLKSGIVEKRAKSKLDLKKAETLLEQAEYPQAIAIYERVFADTADPSVKKLLEDVKKLWEPQNQQHKEAREIIFTEWPKCTTARQMKDKLEEVKKAFAVCEAAKDFLTARKLAMVNQDHVAQLRAEIDTLKDNEEDRDTLEIFKTLPQDLDAFIKSVAEFSAKAKPSNLGKK